MLKVLAKEQSYNEGNLSISNDLVLGYLMQDLDFVDSQSVIEEAQTAFENLNQIELMMNEANQKLLNVLIMKVRSI